MWNRVGLGVVALVMICFTHWFRKWRNPKCNGVLPPGSMGFPLIGETLSLTIPSYSLDFILSYGPIFKTNIIGHPALVSADPEFNDYIIQQKGRLVDLMGAESIKERLLPQIEQFINKTLMAWSTQSSVEAKNAIGNMVVDFNANIMIGYDAEKSNTSLSKVYKRITESLMSFPLNIPGTTNYKCLKEQKEIISMLKDMLKERRLSPNSNKEDYLGKLSKDMDSEKFLTEKFIVHLIFGLFFASFESISSLLTLVLKFLSENPLAMKELEVSGWTVMLVTSAKQLNPNTFKNPLEFNPWRWKTNFT
ncbi:hypothetical protein UlMin_031509 [Ulmus minor]